MLFLVFLQSTSNLLKRNWSLQENDQNYCETNFFFFLEDCTGCNFRYHFMLTIYWVHSGPTYHSPQPVFLLCWGKTKLVNHRYFLFLISYQYCLIPFHPNQYGTSTFLSIHLKESKSCHKRQIKASEQKKQSTAWIFNRSLYSLRRNCR